MFDGAFSRNVHLISMAMNARPTKNNQTPWRKMESGTCGVFKTHLSPTRARCPHFRFVPDGSALQSVENGKAKVHLLQGALAGEWPAMPAPLTWLVDLVNRQLRHVLEVQREYGPLRNSARRVRIVPQL
jgi:hypothetical protein